MMIYKAPNSLGPGYLKECLSQYKPTWTLLRSAGEALFYALSLQKVCYVAARRRGVSVVAPQRWNAFSVGAWLAPSQDALIYESSGVG